MGIPTLEAPVRYWNCGACGTVDRTQRSDVHTQFHDCPALGGLNVPLSEVAHPDDKPRNRQVAVYSEYGPELAAVSTERMDGSNDVTVFPQPAVGIMSS